ncbi:MAG: 2'-5' RNA ligase family protein [Actinomycetota bacterium]|nr:2'-5' RNA ligase family protein [Actinomycetota bacterium]
MSTNAFLAGDTMGMQSQDGLSHMKLGIAISIPDPLGALLTEWRVKVGDPLAHLIPPHVTLLPPTDVGRAQLDEVHLHLSAVAARHSPFQLHLAGTGSFRPISEVVFVTVAEGISSCELLAQDIRSGLLARPLDYPYHPHVTIAHDVAPDMLDLAYQSLVDVDVRLEVDAFCAFSRDLSGRWVPATEYPLLGGRDG